MSQGTDLSVAPAHDSFGLAGWGGQLLWQRLEDGSGLWVCLCGELDALTVPDLRGEIDQVMATARSDVLVDLSHLERLDASGVALLFDLVRRVHLHQHKLCVQGLHGQPYDVLHLLAMDRSLATEERERPSILSRIARWLQPAPTRCCERLKLLAASSAVPA